MYTVKRAVILAAGMGTRMRPITYEKPKALIAVNGTPIIDTIINGLNANGISEIYVVVGYLKEQFYNWAVDKPNIHIIENPCYDTCNNISSLYFARNHLNSCIILDGDQIINNTAVLNPCFTRSGYNAAWCDGPTNEWLLTVENGIVGSCSRFGGSHGWQLYSVSRWSEKEGRKLSRHIEHEFESNNRQIYWDDIPIFLYSDDYELGIFEMQQGDVVEVDSIRELTVVDHSYEIYLH